MAWNTLGRKLTWFNRPQRIPSTPEAIELHNLESRRIIRKYNDRCLFEEGNVRQYVANTQRGGSAVTSGVTLSDAVGGDVLTRIRPGHFVTAVRPIQNMAFPETLIESAQFTQYTSVEHQDGYITRIFSNTIQSIDDADGVAIGAADPPANNSLSELANDQDADGDAADVYTPVWIAQEPQEFAGGRTIMHEYYPAERLIFIIPRRGVWVQVRVHNAYTAVFNEGDFVRISKVGTAMHAPTDGTGVVGIVRQGTDGGEFTVDKQNALSATTPKYDARLVTIEIV